MSAQPKPDMTADEFLAWAEGQLGRFELHRGTVFAMAPERAGHARVKLGAARALQTAIAGGECGCWVLPDGMTVRIDARVVYEPDALVYCGEQISDDAIEVAEPVIVVEVLSPSTRQIDISAKLIDYFKVPSIQHYLIIDPSSPPIIHHQRGPDGLILTRIVAGDAALLLDPPGLSLDVGSIFAPA
jgi:Uma2 family endonuclease